MRRSISILEQTIAKQQGGQQAGGATMRASKGGPKVGVSKSSGDIISWATPPTSSEGQPLSHHNQRPAALSPSGRRRVAAVSGMAPYGLDGRDDLVSSNMHGITSRRAETAGTNPNMSRPQHGFSFAPPFGTEVDM
jgi:hypothetical protein